jgi:DNA-binding transcriptional LysR family regulator
MVMELTDLALFLEVTEQGSLSRAAGALRLAQPSVSARVAGLERSLRLELFDRSTKGVTLTAAGRALVPYARRCLALAEEGRLAARASAGSQRLVLASPPSLAASIFPPLVAALSAEPLEIVCRTAHSREVIEQLVDGAAHVGFLLGAAAPGGIQVEPLYTTPIICIARRGHPLALAGPGRLSDLSGHLIAVHAWGPEASELGDALREAGIPPTRVCWVSPSSTALALAVRHGYVAVLPADAVATDLRAGAVELLRPTGLPEWSLDVSVAYRHRAAAAGPVAVALRAVRSLPPT